MHESSAGSKNLAMKPLQNKAATVRLPERIEIIGPVTPEYSRVLTLEAMKFIAPIHLRDLISVYAHVERVGRTSMGVRIEVVATRDLGATEVKVTEGLFTFVALDASNRPRPVDSLA